MTARSASKNQDLTWQLVSFFLLRTKIINMKNFSYEWSHGRLINNLKIKWRTRMYAGLKDYDDGSLLIIVIKLKLYSPIAKFDPGSLTLKLVMYHD